MKTTGKIKLFAYFLIVCMLSINSLFAIGTAPIDPNIKAKASQWMGQKKQLGFLENKGQMADINGKPANYVLFKTEAPGINIWVTNTGLTYQFLKFEEDDKVKRGESQNSKDEELLNHNKDEDIKVSWHRVDMILKNANIKKENIVTENDITQGKIDFYLGHCPDGIFNVKTFSKITIKDIYKGIDWVLYSNNGLAGNSLKQDFIVHPNADPNQIKLIYEGSGKFDVTNNQIHFENEIGELHEGKLFCYQENETNKVESSYVVNRNISTTNSGAGNFISNNNNTQILNSNYEVFSYKIGFQLKNYDKSKDLVIDPQLFWSTFYGGNNGNGGESPYSICTDQATNLFITGIVSSTNFPIQNSGAYFQGSLAGLENAFILKFNNAGNLLWATYYGGGNRDTPISISCDNNNNVIIGGITLSNNFPLQSAGTYFQNAFLGWSMAFILKFNNIGNRLWATYYGGGSEYLSSITCDNNSNIWITGTTYSTNFPVQNSGTYFQGTLAGTGNVFILKFDNIGNRLWATYYGGNDNDQGHSITSDNAGNIFITGVTRSTNFPLQNTGTFFQGAPGGVGIGANDAFILKFDNLGNRLWASYYGGSNMDSGSSIICDNNGNVFVEGLTRSTNLPVQNAGTYFQGVLAGVSDIFILKFDNIGNRLWASYYGGSNEEPQPTGRSSYMDINSCDDVYIIFDTWSSDVSTFQSCDGGYFDNSFGGGVWDIFIAKFSNNGTLTWGSYVGGDGMDNIGLITIDKNNNVYISGTCQNIINNTSYPLINPGGGAYFDGTYNGGGNDAFIAKFNAPQILTTSATTPANCKCTGTASVNASGGCGGYIYQWYTNTWAAIGTDHDTIQHLCPGTYHVVVQDTLSCSAKDTSTITITGNPAPTAAAQSDTTLQLGQSATLTASGGVTYNWFPSTGLNINTGNTVIATPTVTTMYCVEVEDSVGCKDTACVTVMVEEPCLTNYDLKIPNAFSPNADNVNDIFCLQGWNYCLDEFIVYIYDRWGEKVFESTNPDFCWDGKFNNKIMEAQVFVYYIEIKYSNIEQPIIKKGNISLLK